MDGVTYLLGSLPEGEYVPSRSFKTPTYHAGGQIYLALRVPGQDDRILVNSTISSHLDPFRGHLRKGVATNCPHMQDARKALLDKCGVLACPGMGRNSSREKVYHKATLTSPMRQAKGSSPPCNNRQKKLPMELKLYFL